MEELESGKMKTENLRQQFINTKQLIDETLKKNEKVKSDLVKEKKEYTRALHNLQKIHSSQCLKISNLSTEIENLESMCRNVGNEKNYLSSIVGDLKRQLENLKAESYKMAAEELQACADLDREIRHGYVKFQTEQELITLWEVNQNLPPEEHEIFKKVFLKTLKETEKMYENFKKELADLDEVLFRLKMDIKTKKREFNEAEGKYMWYENKKAELQKDIEERKASKNL